MKRSVWKLPYLHKSLQKLNLYSKSSNKILLLTARNSIIPSYLVGRKIRIYNGAWLLTTFIEKSMLGTKLGQYSITKQMDMQARIKAKKIKKQPKKK